MTSKIDFSPERLRARFAELNELKAAIQAVSVPLREERDAKLAVFRDKEVDLNAKIIKAEADLFEIDQEAAMIVRALAGKVTASDED